MERQWIYDLDCYTPHLSAVSFLVNSIHSVVLVQKSMRTSSTNIILLAIAISNLAYMAYPIIDWLKKAYDITKTCILPDSYAYVFFEWIYFSLQDDVRRCDAFLGLAMASIRTFVLKFPMSSIISFALFLGTQIAHVGYIEWECYEESNPNKTSFELYIMVPSTLSEWNGFLYSKLYLVMNAIFSKILPPVLFPILTILLIVEIRKITETRNRMFSSSNQNKNSATTKFVIFNTIAYVISSLPAGIFYLTYSFFPLWCLDVECYDFLLVFDFLTSFITLTHFPICLAMSTQYRSTVLGFFRSKDSSGTTVWKPNTITGNAI
ncbi:unnamed protein product [Caenorhabditis nigoni]